MNSHISDAALSKASKDPYRTRFLLQSERSPTGRQHRVVTTSIPKTRRSSVNQKKSSVTVTDGGGIPNIKLISLLGGTAVFELWVVTACGRIAQDKALEPIYGGSGGGRGHSATVKSLIPLHRQLLLFALLLSEENMEVDTSILFHHCELGLMAAEEQQQEEEEQEHASSHLQILMDHYWTSLKDCCEDDYVLMECGLRLAQLRPILKETHRQMIIQSSSTSSSVSLYGEEDEEDTNITEPSHSRKSRNGTSSASCSPKPRRSTVKRTSLLKRMWKNKAPGEASESSYGSS
eukprot:scaffold11940_cov116-Cylindrotheca_fusiformis.AAC.4